MDVESWDRRDSKVLVKIPSVRHLRCVTFK